MVLPVVLAVSVVALQRWKGWKPRTENTSGERHCWKQAVVEPLSQAARRIVRAPTTIFASEPVDSNGNADNCSYTHSCGCKECSFSCVVR